MAHPYRLRGRHHAETSEPVKRYTGMTHREAVDFLKSLDANTREEKRFKAQHILVTALLRNHLQADLAAEAAQVLYEDFRDKRMSTGVERRLRQNERLAPLVLRS